MKSKISKIHPRSAILILLLAAMSLAGAGEAAAYCGRRYVVVRRARVHRVVVPRPRPVVVRYVPAYHTACVWRSGYYYSPRFGYHRHVYHPGGIYFGVDLVF